VWQQGTDVALYITEPLNGYSPTIRLVYPFDADGILGYFGCPVDQDLKACVKASFAFAESDGQPQTCTTTVDLRNIPAWQPSPDSSAKRKIASELLSEIEDKWPGAQEIRVRDFNLKDSQITMVLKLPDMDYVQGCGFYAMKQPHCVGWHSFGMVPWSKIEKWVLERPYRLK
jgi:hypothetical protein